MGSGWKTLRGNVCHVMLDLIWKICFVTTTNMYTWTCIHLVDCIKESKIYLGQDTIQASSRTLDLKCELLKMLVFKTWHNTTNCVVHTEFKCKCQITTNQVTNDLSIICMYSMYDTLGKVWVLQKGYGPNVFVRSC